MKREGDSSLLHLDPAWRERVKTTWLRLMEIAVWGELRGGPVGTQPRLRKRLLDLGERWRSLFNDRDWIPHRRERLKNALGSALALRESFGLLERVSAEVEDRGDGGEFRRLLATLHDDVEIRLREHENRWAVALEELNKAP